MRLPKLTLGIKLPLLFVVITTVPLIAVSIIWFCTFRSQFIELTTQQLFHALLLNIFLVVIIIIIVSLISLSIASSITASIEELRQGVHYIGAGNLLHRLKITTHNEIGDLANSFNTMSAN